MINRYNLEGKNIKGSIELEYTSGYLTGIKLAFNDPLTDDKFKLLFGTIGYFENRIEQLAKLGFTITRQMASNEKLALFCRKYEQAKGIKYRVSGRDAGKIKLVPITEPMLDVYFNSANTLFKDKHSVSNLVNFYNELLVEVKNGMKSKHPNNYNALYEATLSAKGQQEYWQHLRSQGLMAKRDRNGIVTDWIKA